MQASTSQFNDAYAFPHRAWYHTWSYGRCHLDDVADTTQTLPYRIPPRPLQSTLDTERQRIEQGSLKSLEHCCKTATDISHAKNQIRRALPPTPRQRAARMGCQHEPPCWAVATAASVRGVDIPKESTLRRKRGLSSLLLAASEREKHSQFN